MGCAPKQGLDPQHCGAGTGLVGQARTRSRTISCAEGGGGRHGRRRGTERPEPHAGNRIIECRHGARRHCGLPPVRAQQHRDDRASHLRHVAWRRTVRRQLAEQPVRAARRPPAHPARARGGAARKPLRHDRGSVGVHRAVPGPRRLLRAVAGRGPAPGAGVRAGAVPTERGAVPRSHLPRLQAGEAVGNRAVRNHRLADGGAGDHLPAHRRARVRGVLRRARACGNVRHGRRPRAAARPHGSSLAARSSRTPRAPRVLSPGPAGAPPRQPAPARVGLQRGHELRPDPRRRSARILQRRHAVRVPQHRRPRRQPRRRMGDRSVRREALGGLHHRRQRPGAAAHGAGPQPRSGPRGGRSCAERDTSAPRPRSSPPRAHRRAAAPARSWRGSKARSTWE